MFYLRFIAKFIAGYLAIGVAFDILFLVFVGGADLPFLLTLAISWPVFVAMALIFALAALGAPY